MHLLASSSSWQAKILKVINSFHNKEELLAYVSTCHAQLDDINLVTVIYRLARMFSTVRSPAARWRWSNDLQGDTTFQQLLGGLERIPVPDATCHRAVPSHWMSLWCCLPESFCCDH